MNRATIKVKMKRGGNLLLEAEGRCYQDSDGAGQEYKGVEELELYWPRKKRDKKSYPVKPELVADWEQVQEAFWEAVSEQANDAELEARIMAYESRY